ncbi:MAG: phosphotransferase [Kofleriaceae bacterium]|nr:phosphotransferase [Kofleriaceae bacterium]
MARARRGRGQAGPPRRRLEELRATRARGQGPGPAPPPRRAAALGRARGAAGVFNPGHAADAGRGPARGEQAPAAQRARAARRAGARPRDPRLGSPPARRRMVHRDIKPSNLVLDGDGALALVDFGGVADARPEGAGARLDPGRHLRLHGAGRSSTARPRRPPTSTRWARPSSPWPAGSSPSDVPRKGLKMDRRATTTCRRCRPACARCSRPWSEADPDRRPQRPREVAAMLAKASDRPRAAAAADTERARGPWPWWRRRPARWRRREPIFVSMPEPLGALLRLSVLGVALGGWVSMALTAWTLQAIGWTVGLVSGGKTSPVRRATGDVAGVLTTVTAATASPNRPARGGAAAALISAPLPRRATARRAAPAAKPPSTSTSSTSPRRWAARSCRARAAHAVDAPAAVERAQNGVSLLAGRPRCALDQAVGEGRPGRAGRRARTRRRCSRRFAVGVTGS